MFFVCVMKNESIKFKGYNKFNWKEEPKYLWKFVPVSLYQLKIICLLSLV
jgi:hypothetical protein